MAPGKAAKRAEDAPKQQQQRKKKEGKQKPKQHGGRGGRGGGERVVLRWEAVEEDVIEVTTTPMAASGKAAAAKSKKKLTKRKGGQGDTFDDDALVGISDEEDEGEEESESGTFGGSKFVMLDVEDDLEQLALEASALPISGSRSGSSERLPQTVKPSKSSKKKKNKKPKEDPPSQSTLTLGCASSSSRPKSAAQKADGKAGGSKKSPTDRGTGKQNAEAQGKKAPTVDANSKKTPKKKEKNPASTAPNDTRVDEKAKKRNDREKSRPDSTPGDKSKHEQRSHGRAEQGGRANGDADSKTVYTDYLARDVVTRGLEDGSLLQGKLRVNAMYRMDGYVTVDGIAMDILVKGMADRNRAVDGDLVAIKLHPEEEWKSLGDASDDVKAVTSVQMTQLADMSPPKPEIDANALHSLWRPNVDSSKCIIHTVEGKDDKGSDANSKLKAEVARINERARKTRSRPTATVVYVLAAGNSGGFIGCLEPRTKMADVNAPLPSDDAYAYFNAHDQRLPRRIQIPRLQLPDEFIRRPVVYSKTMLCFCRIKAWSTQYRSPKGEFVKTVGEYTGIDTGISAILSKNDLQAHTLDFSSAILEELDAKYGTSGEKWDIPDEEVHKRRDFRDYQIFSIDPYNARDLDDALHIRALDDARTTFEIGVHIADVTHFVDHNSLLDKEAQSRATSVYLPNRVLPMLPRILCEKLCSLQPQVDRLAFSVVWQMSIDGTLVEGAEPWFGKSIIRSCCKLDYGSAQKMIDGTITSDTLDEWEVDRRPISGANPAITDASVIQSVKDLWAIGKNRRAMRFDTGAISLNDIKLVFTLDQKGNPTRFGSYQIKDSNRLVEEYMLLANFLVAQKLLQAHGPLAFIRHHPAPVERAMELTLGTLKEHSIEIDGSTTKRLSDSLDRVRRDHGETAFAIVQAMLIKPMKPAEYMVAGNGASPDSWRHYALNIPYYTHFTSPIRRYADVVVHRLLQESVTSEPFKSDNVSARLIEFTSIAQNCNDKKMAAKAAEKECDEVFLCAYVKHLGAVDVTGVVMSSGQQSFTVYIMELGVERRLFLKDLHTTGAWDEKAKVLTIQLLTPKDKSKKQKQKQRRLKQADGEQKEEEEKEEQKEGSPSSSSSPAADTSADNDEEALPAPPRMLRLAFMTQVKLKMSATTKMPLALTFALVGAADYRRLAHVE